MRGRQESAEGPGKEGRLPQKAGEGKRQVSQDSKGDLVRHCPGSL